MRLRSAPILGCFAIFFTLADYHFDCKDLGGASLLDGLWLAGAVANTNQGDSRLQDEIDQLAQDTADLSSQVTDLTGRTTPGTPGLACWDLNGNGQADADEDVNLDGKWDAFDCQGAQGLAGLDGTDGTDGTNGTNGTDGTNGTNGTNGVDGQDGQDLRGVLARGRVDGTTGLTISATNLTADLYVPGQHGLYEIVADVSGYGPQRILDEGRQSIDFPVFLTVRGYVDEYGQGSALPLLAFYEFADIIPGNPDPDPALHVDATAGTATLTFLVRVIDVTDGQLARPGDFSVLVLEP